MKRRHLMALAGAVLVLLVDMLAFPFLLGGASSLVEGVFYAPAMLGERLLVWARDSLGWSIPTGFKSPLSRDWDLALLLFNWGCYAALGLFSGLTLGRVLWKER